MAAADPSQYVNRELSALGFPAPFDFATGSDSKRVVSCIFSLLQQLSKESTIRNDLKIKLSQAIEDFNEANRINERLIAKLDNSNRLVASLTSKANLAEHELGKAKKDLSSTKDSLKTCQKDIAFMRAQFDNEVRKKSTEIEKLKDRLAKVLAEKTTSQISFTLANPLPKIIKAAQIQKSTEDQDHDVMLNIVLEDYEKRELKVMHENECMRKCLFNLYEAINSSVDLQVPKIQEARFKLPFDDVKAPIEESINSCCEKLKSMAVTDSATKIEALLEKIDELNSKNDENMRVIQEQGKLIEQSLASPSENHALKGTRGNINDCDYSQGDLEAQYKELELEREKLNLERKQFTDAAIKLGVERANLMREKTILLQQQQNTANSNKAGASSASDFLNSLPSTPKWLKAKPFPESTTTSSSMKKEVSFKENISTIAGTPTKTQLMHNDSKTDHDNENQNDQDDDYDSFSENKNPSRHEYEPSTIFVESNTLKTPFGESKTNTRLINSRKNTPFSFKKTLIETGNNNTTDNLKKTPLDKSARKQGFMKNDSRRNSTSDQDDDAPLTPFTARLMASSTPIEYNDQDNEF